MQTRKAAVGFIFVTLFLDILGIGIVVPVLPALVTEFRGGDPSAGAEAYGPIVALYATAQFLCAPVLGALSDRFGRRPVLLISLFGFGVDYLVQGFAPSLGWLMVGRVFAGALGASITTGNAYLADISTPETRARNFGLVGAAFGLGFVLGPALGGLLGHYGRRWPFFLAAGLALCNWLYGYFVLPESLPKERRRAIDWRQANPVAVLARLRAYPVVAALAVAWLLLALGQRGMESVWVLHATLRYGWDELHNGLSLAAVGVGAVIVQGGLIRRVVPRLGEWRTASFAVGMLVLGFCGFALASSGTRLLASIPLIALGGMTGPSLQGIITGAVRPDEHGAVQGALTSLNSLTAVFAPLITTGLFHHFTTPGHPFVPGAPFLASAAFAAAAGGVVLLARRRFGAG